MTAIKGDKVEATYVNPRWLAAAFRLSTDHAALAASVAEHVGSVATYGSKAGGLNEAKLRKYHYKLGMPYFDEPDKVGKFASFQEGRDKVEAGLAKAVEAGVARLVYRLDVPGKEESVYGVALLEGNGADAAVLRTCSENCAHSHAAHFPYELVLSGTAAYALDAKFRIAQSWPDTTMGTFMKISLAPGAICKLFKKVAAGGGDFKAE